MADPKLQSLLDEGLEILSNLDASIRKHGNYSPEATCTFIDQAGQCFREASRYLATPQEPAPVEDTWLVVNGSDGSCAKVVIGFESMKREVVAAVFGDADDDSDEAQQMRERLETLSDWEGDRWSISWSFEDGYLNVQRITHFGAAE